ncbi:MAG: hypothetical protein F6J93_13365 [Oscillatoria sp. SIO1A7]|nr:hypothetical protein [Oscillatoria sp. SIO1A7]
MMRTEEMPELAIDGQGKAGMRLKMKGRGRGACPAFAFWFLTGNIHSIYVE